MLFLGAVSLALALLLGGPLAAIVAIAWRARPRAAAGVLAAGLVGVPAGALLYLLSHVLKSVLTLALPDWVITPEAARSLLVHSLAAGLVASVCEEVVRFGAAGLLFRRAQGRPIVAAALFGLGWGGIEVLFVTGHLVSQVWFQWKLYGAGAVPMPGYSLLVAAERAGAMFLHVGLAAAAVTAAMALARGRAAWAGALFAFALAVHALPDAWVRAMSVLHVSRLVIGEGLPGTIAMEAGFIAAGAATLAWATRLQAPAAPARASEEGRSPAA